MITAEEKKKIAAKIKALFAKTTEAGASEFEAMAAMAKGRELLEKYQLDLSDLDIREEGTDVKRCDYTFVSEQLYYEVGQYCECRSWRSSEYVVKPMKRKNSRQQYELQYHFKFVGIKSDVVFAEWLMSALCAFVDNQQADYYMDHPAVSIAQSKDFVAGCVQRIKERLMHEVAERLRNRPLSTGRDLVPLKNAMITEKMAAMGVKLTSYTRAGINYRDAGAFVAGRAAGETVGLHRPMNYQTSDPKMIGSK
jgi:hypothetical protein